MESVKLKGAVAEEALTPETEWRFFEKVSKHVNYALE